MKKYLWLIPTIALLAACEQKTETTAAPGAPEKKVNNTTVVNPGGNSSSASSTDTTKTKTSTATGSGSTSSSSTTTTSSTPH